MSISTAAAFRKAPMQAYAQTTTGGGGGTGGAGDNNLAISSNYFSQHANGGNANGGFAFYF
jgi:hypothetical protein